MPKYRVIKRIDFCYGHRLLNYEGKCRHFHGHNGRVEVCLAADRLDERGMVVDFFEIKRKLKGWIEQNLDNRMILHEADPLVPVLKEMREPVFLLKENSTAENLAKLIFEAALKLELPVQEVRFWETPDSCATYRP